MKICLGTVSFGMDYGIKGGKKPTLENVLSLLESAVFECGVDCFDTAAAYGEAESVLGAFFEKFPSCKDTVSVISKLPADALLGAHESEYPLIIRKSVESSLSRLKLDILDGYLLHNPAHATNPNILDSLWSLKNQNLVKRVGVSCYKPEEALLASKNLHIDDIQILFNAFDHRLLKTEFFDRCCESKRIFERSVFLQGLLVMEQLPEKMSFAGEVVSKFQDIARDYKLSYNEACLMFASSVPQIDYLVLGIDDISELKQNIKALEVPVSEAFIAECKSAFNTVDERILMPSFWHVQEG